MSENIVAILGCGPAGLLSAHAVKLMGRQPVIFSKAVEKSQISGAQYVHEPVPEINDSLDPDGFIKFIKHGTRDGYAQKVYGSASAPCSWDAFRTDIDHPAWSMQKLYDRLWEKYGDKIIPMEVTSGEIPEMIRDYPLVLSSIPAPSLCHQPLSHDFPFVKVHIVDKAWNECPEDSIVYNGDLNDPWYRSSRLFGHESTEFPTTMGEGVEYISPTSDAQILPARVGIKPLDTNCDCHPEVKRVGRFGRWKKGVLVNHAFRETWSHLFDAFEGQ